MGQWIKVSNSVYPHEQEALDYVQSRLGDDVYEAWSNFEFVASDGSVNEVDLLLASPAGIFLIEIKSRPGKVSGDQHSWTWNTPRGRRSFDNPIFLAERKAKRLASLLQTQPAFRSTPRTQGSSGLYIASAIFLSDPTNHVDLDGPLASRVFTRSEIPCAHRPGTFTVAEFLKSAHEPGSERARELIRGRRLLSQAMDQAGLRPRRHQRQVGDWVLSTLLDQGKFHQDFLGTKTGIDRQILQRRIRVYAIRNNETRENRELIQRVVRKEASTLQGLNHPGILRYYDQIDSELGPAVVLDHCPAYTRLDYYLKENDSRLSFADRLGLLEQLAETLNAIHSARLEHRAISPESLLVDSAATPPRLLLFNWQTAVRQIETTTTGGTVLPESASFHPDVHSEEASGAYHAPESRTTRQPRGVACDIFGFGAVAYFLFTGQAPASQHNTLRERLQRDGCLNPVALAPGLPRSLVELIKTATRGSADARYLDARALSEAVEKVEEEITRPDDLVDNPHDAVPGSRLDGGFQVESRLGAGSTAVVFRAHKDNQQVVLKVARDFNRNKILQDEAEVLHLIRHEHVVRLIERRQLNGYETLVLEEAKDETLARALRRDGPLEPEDLARFGDELLGVVRWLEENGFVHRDIKPDNIAITTTRPRRIKLFDFSLARVSPKHRDAGTRAYLDPFLGDPKRQVYDAAAERWAAALTLFEAATTCLPEFGDGSNDPSHSTEPMQLGALDVVPLPARAVLRAFFERSFRRAAAERHTSGDEMLSEWRRVMVTLRDQKERRAAETLIHPSAAARDTSVEVLDLSTRARNVLVREGYATCGAVRDLPLDAVDLFAGAGLKTRTEIRQLISELSHLAPGVPVAPAPESAVAKATLPQQIQDLIQKTARRNESQTKILRAYLALEDIPGTAFWPKQTEIADALNSRPAEISRLLKTLRQHTRANPLMQLLRTQVVDLVRGEGGLAAETTLVRRLEAGGSILAAGDEQRPWWRAAARILVEWEADESSPRLVYRRLGSRVLLAAVETFGDVDGATTALYRIPSIVQALERLVADAQVVDQERVSTALRTSTAKSGLSQVLKPQLLRFLVSASDRVDLSARAELYPVGLAARRAFDLCVSGLFTRDDDVYTVDEVRNLVASRFPAAEQLPGRAELDLWFRDAVVRVNFDPAAAAGTGAYVLEGAVSSGFRTSTLIPQIPDIPSSASHLLVPAEERLRRIRERGGFLVLQVTRPSYRRALAELSRILKARPLALDLALITHMQKAAENLGVAWDLVRRTDAAGPGSPEWPHLRRLAEAGLHSLLNDLRNGPSQGLVVCAHLGLLRRYHLLHVLDELRQLTDESPPVFFGLLLLVPKSPRGGQPMVDDELIPLLNTNHWATLDAAFFEPGTADTPT